MSYTTDLGNQIQRMLSEGYDSLEISRQLEVPVQWIWTIESNAALFFQKPSTKAKSKSKSKSKSINSR